MPFPKILYSLLFTLSSLLIACAQPGPEPTMGEDTERQAVGGPCEGCEAALEYGNRELSAVDTIYGYSEGESPIEIRGTVYKPDGKTPAAGIILYIYHTDSEGRYTPAKGATGWAEKHGQRRIWLRTNENGRYGFFTQRPASYPNTDISRHIHITVVEPELEPYYLASYKFADDPNLSVREQNSASARGGNGILENGRQLNDRTVYERDIVLGLHVPDYR